MRTKKPQGLILYEGPSQLDGKPIVVIATGFKRKSRNKKTGNMIQTWILCSDIDPVTAVMTGRDVSVCGGCALRGLIIKIGRKLRNRKRICYVRVGQAPRQVYECYRRGGYDPYDHRLHKHLLTGRKIRLGAYGEPTAAPYSVWSGVVKHANGHTGYTHTWRTGKFWRFRRLVMASVESIDQANQAHDKQWRTFRTGAKGETAISGEFPCPASEEQGHRLDCENCGACNGNDAGLTQLSLRASVFIPIHGSPSTLGSYRRTFGK